MRFEPVELAPRQETILRAVVVEYIEAAEPVGSELIATKYSLGVRSATIRNELAEIAEMGLLEQPHTSAGRIPSDRGYRYFVDRLIIVRPPRPPERQHVREATREADAVPTMLQETTRVLSRLCQLLSAAVISGAAHTKVRHALISALGPDRALLVLVLNNGHMENRLLPIPPGVTLDHLGLVNELARELLEGRTLAAVKRAKAPALDHEPLREFMGSVLGAAKSIARDLSRGRIFFDGIEYLIDQPEIHRSPELLRNLLSWLEGDQMAEEILALPEGVDRQVTIGKEHDAEELRPFTVIRQRFYAGEDQIGAIAVIGPTRMRYEESIPLVEYAAKALSQALGRLAP